MAHPTLTTRVLLYRDEGEWIAHSLELDLVGTGENEEEAKKELVGAIVTQVEFCYEKGWDPFSPAPATLSGTCATSTSVLICEILGKSLFAPLSELCER